MLSQQAQNCTRLARGRKEKQAEIRSSGKRGGEETEEEEVAEAEEEEEEEEEEP